MYDNRPTHVDPGQLFAWLFTYRWRWIAPTLMVTAAATAYAVLKPAEWDASQALTIRNEAANNEDGPGNFGHSEERRTAQETVLELAKSRAVLAAALKVVGPPQPRPGADRPWPNEKDVDDFRKHVTLTPPKGAELGRTEVFYLTVRDRQRGRAVKLVAAVRDELEERYRQLRDAKAKSMSAELRRAVQMARKNLEEATARVAKTEAEVGEDLGDLRMLHESITGETSLQRTAMELRSELRQIENSRQSTEELIGLLKEAQKDPQRLVATPNRLIDSQPGLRQLKQGLVEAQLRTAALLGRMSHVHPEVVAARESELEVRRNIHAELAEAISGLELELRLNGMQEKTLQTRLADVDRRLARLASLRASYGSNLAEVANRAELLRQAEDDLSQAEVSEVGADAASLIGRIDVPTVGTRPAGPGRALIVLVGAVGGLLVGLGLLVLTAPLPIGEWEIDQGSPEVVVVVQSPEDRPAPAVEVKEQQVPAPVIEVNEPQVLAPVIEVNEEQVPALVIEVNEEQVPAPRPEPAIPSTARRPQPPPEVSAPAKPREAQRMPDTSSSSDAAAGLTLTLKEALQRVGPP